MRTLIIGLDAFDPSIFEEMCGRGELPNLSRLAAAGGYSRFAVANPPQSEVSWTSIATGLNPGTHGIFDFVHRDPATYGLYVSLLPTRRTVAGTQFVPPFTAPTIFDQVAAQGFPATSLWWPATFPARLNSPVRTVPGLGTPDVLGKLGVGVQFSTRLDSPAQIGKTPRVPLHADGKDRFTARIKGPKQQSRTGVRESETELIVERRDDGRVRIKAGTNTLELVIGQWSPVVELVFSLGRLVSIPTLTRVIVTEAAPHVSLYFLPLQLHPLHSLWPYASPAGFIKETWRAAGPFLTLGWPQDTTGLEDGCIAEDHFLALCDSIEFAREAALLHHLQNFREGLVGIVFDSLDRIQHMFWSSRPDVVRRWYTHLDDLIGRVQSRLQSVPSKEPARVVILSDHGFSRFDYKVNLNRWLLENGLLSANTRDGAGKLADVDWLDTRAYAIGLNSLYLNLQGREGTGAVAARDREQVLNQVREHLLQWEGPNGARVVQQVLKREEAFEGPLSKHGPDLVIGYAPGFRASQENGLGGWSSMSIELNKDKWAADHCIDPISVPGVLFADTGLADFTNPSYHDIPAITIGGAPDPGRVAPPEPYSEEDQEVIEERLRSLGYL